MARVGRTELLAPASSLKPRHGCCVPGNVSIAGSAEGSGRGAVLPESSLVAVETRPPRVALLGRQPQAWGRLRRGGVEADEASQVNRTQEGLGRRVGKGNFLAGCSEK